MTFDVNQLIADRAGELAATQTKEMIDCCWDLYGFIAGVLPHLPERYHEGASAVLARTREALHD